MKGKIQKIPNIVNQRIPHMGWCQLLPTKKNTLFGVEELNNWVYFVHSYHAIPDDLNFIAEEVIIGGTSNSRGTISSLNRKPLNGTKTFKDLTNSDLTTDGILDWFKKELYPNIRNTAAVDLRYFLKHLKQFYRSKGSEKSFGLQWINNNW